MKESEWAERKRLLFFLGVNEGTRIYTHCQGFVSLYWKQRLSADVCVCVQAAG